MKRKQTQCAKSESTGKTAWLLFTVCFLLFLVSSSGCNSKFLDPGGRLGRFRPTPAVNVILDSLGVAEEPPLAWEDAEEPRPIDTIVVENDYTFRAGDVVQVSVFELLQENLQYVNQFIVTETGKVSIPEVGVVNVLGLTETQLEEEIRQILSPSVLKEPSVTVTLVRSQQRTFSILGNGVPAPGRYTIPRYGFRLADALALAGGPAQFNVSYIYVSRSMDAGRYDGGIDAPMMGPRRGTMDGMNGSDDEMFEIIAPRAQRSGNGSSLVVSSAEFGNNNMRSDVGGFGGNGQNWPSSWDNRTSANRPSGGQSGTNGGDVSVSDILKSLSEKPAGEDRAGSRTRDYRSGTSTAPRQRTGRSQSVGTEDLLRSLSDRPVDSERRSRFASPNRPNVSAGRESRRQVSVDDLLNSLSEQPNGPGADGGGRRADVDEVLQSFEQPPAGAGGQRNGDIDDVLKSLGQPEAPPEPREQMPAEDVESMMPEIVDAEGPAESTGTGRIEWIFKDGKWVPMQVGGPAEPKQPSIQVEPQELLVGPVEEEPTSEVEWDRGAGGRLIRIPADKLLAGDPRYNIVIKPGDTIHVPVDIIGEFCIMGNVNAQGYINITGRPMTLKMAIAAAGGLGPLAVPKRVEVVRRIGRNKEEIVMVDLDKIASGEQPDFFIKPNDLINVGTDAYSRWRAVLRNAFRATYGFGFVYDRNFADRDYFTSRPWPF